jgi:hypothetical protein
MTIEEKIRLQFEVLRRIDGQIAQTDHKIALSLAGLALCGAALFPRLWPSDTTASLFSVELLISFTILISLYYILRAIIPNITISKGHRGLSYIFFGSIAQMTEKTYLAYWTDLDSEDFTHDVANQIYTLSVIALIKVKYTKRAMIFMLALVFEIIIWGAIRIL